MPLSIPPRKRAEFAQAMRQLKAERERAKILEAKKPKPEGRARDAELPSDVPALSHDHPQSPLPGAIKPQTGPTLDLVLIDAILVGDEQAVSDALGAGADPNVGPGQLRPLPLAVNFGMLDKVLLLLSHGADPNLQGLCPGRQERPKARVYSTVRTPLDAATDLDPSVSPNKDGIISALKAAGARM